MDYLEKILSEYSYVIDILKFLAFLLISILLFLKTRDIKYLKGVVDMIPRRNVHYQDTEKVSGQTFENFKPVYRLNKITGELEDTGEVIDISEAVNSYKDLVLDEIFKRFLPTEDDQSGLVYEQSELVDKLDVMRQSFELADQYKERYKLPEDLSPAQVFEEMKKRSEALSKRLSEVETLKKLKEEVSDEKKVEPEGEQTTVQKSGGEG